MVVYQLLSKFSTAQSDRPAQVLFATQSEISMSEVPAIHDTLRLDIEEADLLLNKLNERTASEAERALRKHDRHIYNIREGLIACFEQPNHGWSKYRVRPRNISAGGVSLLHGVFVYPHTCCAVLLKRLDGKHEQITGKVVCSHCVKGRAHEIKIKFDHLIEIENFVVVEKQLQADEYEYHRDELMLVVDELSRAIRSYAPTAEIKQILVRIEIGIQKGINTGKNTQSETTVATS